jgi:thioredoxin-like negative regulator of GroEL
MKDFFAEGRPHEGLSYEEYLADWRAQKEAAPSGEGGKEERKLHHYVRYNYERSEQVHARYEPSEKLQEALSAVEVAQLWMVLTESWCGDSAFCLPVIAEAAGRSEQVTLRILPRDDNLDIMDQYLTGGSRSIPKLVAFEAGSGEERFVWGPRPKGAQDRFDEEAESSDDKEEIVKGLLEHYEDGGWEAVDSELAEALAQAPRPRAERA